MDIGVRMQPVIPKKCAWGFREYQDDPVRVENDRILHQLGYRIHVISGNDAKSPEDWMAHLLTADTNKAITVLVDVSSMTRNWYGGIIRAFARSTRAGGVRTIFAYAPAIWVEAKEAAPPNEVLGPVPGYSSHSLPNMPTALLIGLGQETDRALGLRDHLDPLITLCFYTSPALDARFRRGVLLANKDLLNEIGADQLYKYDGGAKFFQ
jgi:hypothetical protein